jgi:Kef-type K+ transport system membrane component KefB
MWEILFDLVLLLSAAVLLGVALLLFTIGLEFSWQRLRRTGKAGLVGGSAEVEHDSPKR